MPFALDVPGIGLSGIGFGLFAFLAVAARSDSKYADTVQRSDVIWVAGWFLLCIVMTITDVWRIGNIAHATGALAGAVVALAACSRAPRKWLFAVSSSLLLVSLVGIELRPRVPFGGDPHWDLYESQLALREDRLDHAELMATRATRNAPWMGGAWDVLGYVRLVQGRPGAAVEPLSRAIDLYEQGLDPSEVGRIWHNLALAYWELEQFDAANDAAERARSYGYVQEQ